MTINEYAEKVGIGVKKLLGEEYKIDVKTVLKDGGKGLQGSVSGEKGSGWLVYLIWGSLVMVRDYGKKAK